MPRTSGRWPRRIATLSLGLCAAVPALQNAPAPASASGLPASVTIGHAMRRVPSSFVGLSIEYTQLGGFEREGAPVDRAIGMLSSADTSPLLLRVGGASADRQWWQMPGEPAVPSGVLSISSPWLGNLAAMASRDRLHVLLDLNLAVHNPGMSTGFVAAARSALGSNLAAVEIGNEPDHYGRQPWLLKQRPAATMRGVSQTWNRGYKPAHYAHDYRAYAHALRAKFPRLQIDAPELASPNVKWLVPLLRMGRLKPTFVSVHRYASSSCWPKTSPRYPSVPLLLTESVSRGVAGSVRHMAAYARARHTPLRIGEMGTISCGGNAGIANSFATGLWAPDVLFEFLKDGVSGINWHLRPGTYNAPFKLTSRGINARPALYGLAMFAQVVGGPGATLDRSQLTDPGLHLKVWAVRHGHQTRVLVINKSSQAANLTLHAGWSGNASIERLTAPSARATGGLRYAGRWIGSDGRWHGARQVAHARVHGGVTHVWVAGISAAVITIP